MTRARRVTTKTPGASSIGCAGCNSSAGPRTAVRGPLTARAGPLPGQRSSGAAPVASVYGRPGRFEDGGPARDLLFHQRLQRFRRTPRPIRDDAAQFEEAGARRPVVQRLDERTVELGHDVFGRILGREYGVPG